MKKDNIEVQIFQIINKTLSKYKKKISKKDIKLRLYKDGVIDSLDYIRIINDIEKEFKIKMKMETLDINFSVISIKKIINKELLKK